MERLTIKELAPYLPYGLKVIGFNNYINKDMVCDLTDRNLWTHIENQSKPLLRPLSSLTEEIKSKLSQNGRYQLYLYLDSGIPKYKLDFFYSDLQILLAEFYDVFGLIDRGLALPIDGKEVEGCR